MNNSTLIYCLIVIVLMGMAAWYVVRLVRYREGISANLDGMQPYEVGGPLDLIIFFKSAIAPLLAVYAMTEQLLGVQEAPNFVSTVPWGDYVFYFILVQVLLQVANWWVAYGLAFRFTANSARNAKILLLITPAVPVAIYFMSKSFLGESRPINMLVEFMCSFALSILCFSYFTLSAQVRKIYYTPLDKNGNPVDTGAAALRVVTSDGNQTGGASIYSLTRPSIPKGGSKKCPYCSEEIRIDAVKCRFCLSDLES